MLIEEFVSDAFAMFEIVFEDPEIVLFVSVWASVVPITVPAGTAFVPQESIVEPLVIP